jgi:hypothetical protein
MYLMPNTASMLYDLVSCPHRVSMDLFADPTERDRVSPFVQLLWERGLAHEEEVIRGLAVPFLDLSIYTGTEKASGAASIEWFDRWVRGRNPVIRQDILDYNEDDCRATRVLLDGIRAIAADDASNFARSEERGL